MAQRDAASREMLGGISAQVLSQADVVENRAREDATSFQRFTEDLDGECRAGKLDACYVVAELRPAPLFPRLSASPRKAHEKVAERAKYLVDLCRRRHATACGRLGSLVYMHEGSEEVFPLYREGGLPETLEQAISATTLGVRERKMFVASIVQLLASDLSPSKGQMQAWFRACMAGKTHGCLAGSSFNWDAEGDALESRNKMFLAVEIRSERLVADTFARYCVTYRAICARGLYHAKTAERISDEKYGAELGRLCAAGDADGCFREGIRRGYAKDEVGEYEHYRKACDLGSPKGCDNMVDHMTQLGDSKEALSFALRACQSADTFRCHSLVGRFGRSRDFTSRETGRRLLARACSKGYDEGCHALHEVEFQDGDWEAARLGFGRACRDDDNLKACRAAAQVAWSRNQFDSAMELLRKGCLRRDINSCLELATLQAGRGQVRLAMDTLEEWCKKSAGPHPCELRDLVAGGFRPKRLSDIFQEPIDGSEYFWSNKQRPPKQRAIDR
jgi:TPR repeat protein